MAAVALQACGNALLEGASDASKALGRARELLAQESPEDEPYRGAYAAVDEIMRTRDALEADGAQEARSKVRRGAHLKKTKFARESRRQRRCRGVGVHRMRADGRKSSKCRCDCAVAGIAS